MTRVLARGERTAGPWGSLPFPPQGGTSGS